MSLLAFKLREEKGVFTVTGYDSVARQWAKIFGANFFWRTQRNKRTAEEIVYSLNSYVQSLDAQGRIDYSRRTIDAEEVLRAEILKNVGGVAEIRVGHAQKLEDIATKRASVEWEARRQIQGHLEKVREAQVELSRKDGELSTARGEIRRMQQELDRLSSLVGKLTREKA